MKNIRVHPNNKIKTFHSLSSASFPQMDLSKEYTEVNILRRAYELILENSDTFFTELERSFRTEREKGESNPMI